MNSRGPVMSCATSKMLVFVIRIVEMFLLLYVCGLGLQILCTWFWHLRMLGGEVLSWSKLLVKDGDREIYSDRRRKLNLRSSTLKKYIFIYYHIFIYVSNCFKIVSRLFKCLQNDLIAGCWPGTLTFSILTRTWEWMPTQPSPTWLKSLKNCKSRPT